MRKTVQGQVREGLVEYVSQDTRNHPNSNRTRAKSDQAGRSTPRTRQAIENRTRTYPDRVAPWYNVGNRPGDAVPTTEAISDSNRQPKTTLSQFLLDHTLLRDFTVGDTLSSAEVASLETDTRLNKADVFVWAGSQGQTELIRQLLGQNVDVNVESGIEVGNMVTALHLAARNNHAGTLKVLLDAGADIEAVDEHNDTALCFSVRRGHAEPARNLLEHGANCEVNIGPSGNGLHHASMGNDTEMIKLFLSYAPHLLDAMDDQMRLTPLVISCLGNHEESARLLLQSGANPNLEPGPEDGMKVIHTTALAGAQKCVLLLLDSGIIGTEIWQRDSKGRTPFLCAVHHHHWDLAAELLRRGSSINERDMNEETAIVTAASSGSAVDFVKLLYSKGADITLTDNQSFSALHVAVYYDLVATVDFLVSVGAEVEGRNDFGETPILTAARKNRWNVSRQLIDVGAEVHALDSEGRSPLMWAILNSNRIMTSLFLDHGADPEQEDDNGIAPFVLALTRTNKDLMEIRLFLEQGILLAPQNDDETSYDSPCSDESRGVYSWLTLRHAVEYGHRDLVKLLLDFGADPMAKGPDGLTAVDHADSSNFEGDMEAIHDLLQEAVLCGRGAQLRHFLSKAIRRRSRKGVESILDNYSDTNLKDIDGRRPLSLAAEQGDKKIFDLLIRGGAQPWYYDIKGESPLWWACRYGHVGIVHQLLDIDDSSINDGDIDGRTPLMVACHKGHLDIVQLLLEQGSQSQLVRKSNHGKTALHYAAAGGHMNVTQLLVDNGASLIQRCNSGKTALDMAEGADASLRELLTVSGADKPFDEHVEERSGRDDAFDDDLSSSSTAHNESAHYDEDAVACSSQPIATPPDPDRRPEGRDDLYAEDLLKAACRDGVAAINRLIRAGARVDGALNSDYPPIIYAAERGKYAAVAALAENEASMNLANKGGNTLMHYAAMWARTSIISQLLQAGCSLDSRSDSGQTPLATAARFAFRKFDFSLACHEHPEMIDTLAKLGADVNSVDNYGKPPLFEAIFRGNIAAVEVLLRAGADPYLADKNGYTGLGLATRLDDRSIAELFLDRGCWIANTNEQLSALAVAAQEGAERVVDLLLSSGWNVNESCGERNLTPLMIAADCGHTTVVMMLIDAGANTHLKDHQYGQTALAFAKDAGHEAVVKLLYQVSSRAAQTNGRMSGLGPTPLYQTLKFEYQPLDSPRNIRILYLNPAEPGYLLSFELQEVCLDTFTSFDALSYEWGEKFGSIPVECDGKRILITPNCKDALERLRYPDRARALWVDAVCIDQSNIAERNRQVAMMAEIFTRSRGVLMWLGEEDGTTELTFRHIPNLATIYTEVAQECDETTARALFYERDDLQARVPDVELDRDFFLSFSLTTNRNYFSRIWIVQEAILAGQRGTVICGTYECSLKEFEAALRVVRWVDATFDTPARAWNHIRDSLCAHPAFLMHCLRNYDATDKRDRIFVSLGLGNFDNERVKPPPVDYKLSLDDVMMRTAKFFVEYEQNLRMFIFGMEKCGKAPTGPPSWVPDLAFPSTRGLTTLNSELFLNTTTESVVRLADCVPASIITVEDTSMLVNGLLLDQIAFNRAVGPESDLYLDILEPMFHTLGTLGFGLEDAYAPGRAQCRKRTYLQAVVDIIGLDRDRLPYDVEDFLAWKLSGIQKRPTVPNTSVEHWGEVAGKKDAGTERPEELAMHNAMEECITEKGNLVITKKGVIGLTRLDQETVGDSVVLLSTAPCFLLCKAKSMEGEGGRRYYEIIGEFHTDHLDEVEGPAQPVQLHEVWPGDDYYVERMEIR